MIISHEHKFIFIKTRKTAGTSIELELARFCGSGDILTPVRPEPDLGVTGDQTRGRNNRRLFNPLVDLRYGDKSVRVIMQRFFSGVKFYQHIPAALVRKKVSREVWRTYFKFCVERNPWDKSVSHYYWYNWLHGTSLTFEQYIENGIFAVDDNKYTERGSLIVDRVLRFESLESELGEVLQSLGLPWFGHLSYRAKSSHRPGVQGYRQYYDESRRAAIARAFSRTIDLLGFEF